MVMKSRSVTNVLSFDIEEWFHLLEIPTLSDPSCWGQYAHIAERYTDRILETLDRHNIKATFFMVGWVAENFPAITHKIVKSGHEVASHSYWHRAVNKLNAAEFREDLSRSIDILEQQTGQKVRGFRAPGFSITPEMGWAFEAMLDLGLEYDASLIAKQPIASVNDSIVTTTSGRSLPELSCNYFQVGKFGIPYSGGGYFRLLPKAVIRHLMHQQNHRGIPNVLYLHPRDFAVDGPRARLPLMRRFKSFYGLESTQDKLETVLQEFNWDTCASVLGLDRATSPARMPIPAVASVATGLLHNLKHLEMAIDLRDTKVLAA